MAISSYQTKYNEEEVSQYNFSGHDTFPFRYTWLSKGVQKLRVYPDLFSQEDAMVILGVGKNMVRSIKHWCETLGLIANPARGEYVVTTLGNNLFGKDGWDPYLENPGTLWLLHWKLASRFERSSTWYLAFTRWSAPQFSKQQLLTWILNQIDDVSKVRATKNSLKRDIDVFVRTYIPARTGKAKFIEDSFDCPLVDLGLLNEVDKNLYTFVKGEKSSLPKEIFYYALTEYWEQNASDQNTLSFESILYGPSSLGRVFCLTENSLYTRLEKMPRWTGMSYDDNAGMRTVYRQRKIRPMNILTKYYKNQEEGQ